MNEIAQQLTDFDAAEAEKLGLPGVAVGVLTGGREDFACHGVTSVDNPLPVDRDTMFVVGSVSKTFTATALMRLVAEGRVELEAPVRRYVPEFAPTDCTGCGNTPQNCAAAPRVTQPAPPTWSSTTSPTCSMTPSPCHCSARRPRS